MDLLPLLISRESLDQTPNLLYYNHFTGRYTYHYMSYYYKLFTIDV